MNLSIGKTSIVKRFPVMVKSFPAMVKRFSAIVKTFPAKVKRFTVMVKSFPDSKTFSLTSKKSSCNSKMLFQAPSGNISEILFN